jgi:Transposase DDE domain
MVFKSSLQRDLDRFFKQICQSDYSIREVSKSAFTQSRAKLQPTAFKELNTVAVEAFYQTADFDTWNGKRLLSIDGSIVKLPNHATISQAFGQYSMGAKADPDRPTSMATISLLYDVFNQVTLDSEIDRFDCPELTLFERHAKHLKPCDLLLLDRGYCCFWVLFLLAAQKVSFCIRLSSHYNEFKALVESGQQERLVEFRLPRKHRHRLQNHSQWWDKPLTCRLVKVELEDGSIEVLCTSLLDSNLYPAKEFGQLYFHRWGQEETYKLFKCRMEVEQFSGKTALAVKQDFFAKIFVMSLCAINSYPIEEKVRAEATQDKNRKYAQKINRTSAVAQTLEFIFGTFIKKQYRQAILAFDALVEKTREIVRPGRKIKRKHNTKRPYSVNYKPL